MDATLILAISLAENILSSKVSLTTSEEKQSAINFLDSQSDKLAINLVGATPYGLTDEQRGDFLALLCVAVMKLEGGDRNAS
jgi:hypothetical protein